MAKIAKRLQKIREGIDPTKLVALSDAIALVKERAVAKFDETIEVAMNLARAVTFASPSSHVAPRLTKPRLPVQTSSAPKTSSKSFRAARSNSIAASRPRT